VYCSFLQERGYKRKYVEEEIDWARRIPTDKALTEKRKKENVRFPFVATYHSLSSVGELGKAARSRPIHPLGRSNG